MEEILPEIVINWDHTGLNYIPLSNLTMAPEQKVGMLLQKRADTMAGAFLYPQVIYAGKTPCCLPKVTFPTGWHITYSDNHWANERTTEAYINLPFLKRKRTELSLSDTHPALVIFDRFRGQCTDTMLKLLDENNIRIAIVPTNCTDRLQPLDVSVNKSVKELYQEAISELVFGSSLSPSS